MAWIKLADKSELEDGDILGVDVEGKKIALYCDEGEYFATSNICTHEYALLSEGYLDEGIIECPLHQAEFEVRTGRVCTGPAEENIETYPIKVEGEQIFVEVV
jgi:3-phenylpropionate/trans-cinnamate dioxygenase ferredoxin subunit